MEHNEMFGDYLKKAMESEFDEESKHKTPDIFSMMGLIKHTGSMQMSKAAIHRMDEIISTLKEKLNSLDESNKPKHHADATQAILKCAKQLEVLQIVMAWVIKRIVK